MNPGYECDDVGLHKILYLRPLDLSVDAMLSGAIPEGHNVSLSVPSGTGKSLIATHFIAEGL